MLTRAFFDASLKKISAAVRVSEERAKAAGNVYYDILNARLSERQFGKSVNHIVLNCDKFPTIREFLEIARMYPDPEEKQNKQENLCIACNGIGVIHAAKFDEELNQEFDNIFKCSECKGCKEPLPLWHDSLRRQGFKPDVAYKGWSVNDEFQIKGLAMMGEDSFAWKRAPKALQDKARAYMQQPRKQTAGFSTIAGALNAPKELDKERQRQASLKQDRVRDRGENDFE